MMKLSYVAFSAALLVNPALTDEARSEPLTIAMGAGFNSLDPHFFVGNGNITVSKHVFDSLVGTDETLQPLPQLALSWEPLDDLRWQFNLRPHVTFSDGSTFDADDVAASLERTGKVEGSPSSFTVYTRLIDRVEVVDPLTVIVHTTRPNPVLPVELSYVAIISADYANASTDAFNDLSAAVGTGPFKFASYVPNDRAVMVRNEEYWGEQPSWSELTIRVITNNGARSAALLAGDVDAIDLLPAADAERLTQAGATLLRTTSNRAIFLGMDQGREESPYASAPGIPGNPLQNRLVRQALTLAINREALTERILHNQAIPASQLLPEGYLGVSENFPGPTYDPERARELLVEAGYEDGFDLVLDGSNDRYLNVSQVLQAVAQMYGRIGVRTRVEVSPWNTFIAKLVRGDTSSFFSGWGSVTGEIGVSLFITVASVDPELGSGTANRGRYSNPEMDAVLMQAMQTMDRNERGRLLTEANELAMNDAAIIPLYFEVAGWALRSGLTMPTRADQLTLATTIVQE